MNKRPCRACLANARLVHFVANHEDENDEEEFDRLIDIAREHQEKHTCGLDDIACQFCGSGERRPNKERR